MGAARNTNYKDLYFVDVESERQQVQQNDIMMAQKLLQLFRKLQTFKNLRNLREVAQIQLSLRLATYERDEVGLVANVEQGTKAIDESEVGGGGSLA
ncbi:hypothetical protein BGX27_010630 [Mortierella sp. AM989]|nr:hypothetical protein BGX27_010630 [Mortierella sp. AM989]